MISAQEYVYMISALVSLTTLTCTGVYMYSHVPSCAVLYVAAGMQMLAADSMKQVIDFT